MVVMVTTGRGRSEFVFQEPVLWFVAGCCLGKFCVGIFDVAQRACLALTHHGTSLVSVCLGVLCPPTLLIHAQCLRTGEHRYTKKDSSQYELKYSIPGQSSQHSSPKPVGKNGGVIPPTPAAGSKKSTVEALLVGKQLSH